MTISLNIYGLKINGLKSVSTFKALPRSLRGINGEITFKEKFPSPRIHNEINNQLFGWKNLSILPTFRPSPIFLPYPFAFVFIPVYTDLIVSRWLSGSSLACLHGWKGWRTRSTSIQHSNLLVRSSWLKEMSWCYWPYGRWAGSSTPNNLTATRSMKIAGVWHREGNKK